jgi:Low psii accumulation1 / Rep27
MALTEDQLQKMKLREEVENVSQIYHTNLKTLVRSCQTDSACYSLFVYIHQLTTGIAFYTLCAAASIAVVQPFRKVRFFFLYAFVASGTIGLLIATLRTIALTQGIDQGQSFTDLAQNIGIDLAAIIGSALLIKRDIAAQDSRLTRMEVRYSIKVYCSL